ncbi:UDP-glucose--hexose-1-phosphate uridylyltransferase [Collinsella sp. zg1085]|uniref:UDP-glucose--hexose-1-phosphate uridylyltransferase n=1 Tax=Collinsella sp. zg1085 TaxID=2844380 RepID=UPI001C0B09FB|nr:UDP-glucose--hexose-1-phosphate uridylyltransferase [Collinsella sp. zg1085]QWT17442.1 UDP-glucose--hexose-1-phosphate uridylyltransferase [Collinsella sp. zg1085]
MAVSDAAEAYLTDEALQHTLQLFVGYLAHEGFIRDQDIIWAYNVCLALIGQDGPGPDLDWLYAQDFEHFSIDIEPVLTSLAEQACIHGRFEHTGAGIDRASMELMGRFMPSPSQVHDVWKTLCKSSSKRATNWLYGLCCKAGYVRQSAIAKNIQWTTKSPWGMLEITINLSKPEKDPKDIAAALHATHGKDPYPACQLCMTNVGYAGRGAASAAGPHPARQNLRVVPFAFEDETWALQYSPYAYFNEHCIALAPAHRPMKIDRRCFERLIQLTQSIPHYFFGSNADLPIVGGSILTHDHFQGGRHEFPMMRAVAVQEFSIASAPDVTAEVLKWPLTVLRLRSTNAESLLNAAEQVLHTWASYSDEALGIIAQSADGTPHNTITPVAAYDAHSKMHTLYLALRCNITSDEHPLGVFHPHADKHHIKKENIGLIEVMGLAILPPRLVDELATLQELLLDAATRSISKDELVRALENNPLTSSHATWALNLFEKHPELSADTAETILRDAVGTVFGEVLEDAGVYAWDEDGRAGLSRFLKQLG